MPVRVGQQGGESRRRAYVPPEMIHLCGDTDRPGCVIADVDEALGRLKAKFKVAATK